MKWSRRQTDLPQVLNFSKPHADLSMGLFLVQTVETARFHSAHSPPDLVPAVSKLDRVGRACSGRLQRLNPKSCPDKSQTWAG